MVDLDDVSTYPDCIREWVIDKREFFLRVIPIGSYNFDYEIIHKLQDIRIDEISGFKKYLVYIRIRTLPDGILQGLKI